VTFRQGKKTQGKDESQAKKRTVQQIMASSDGTGVAFKKSHSCYDARELRKLSITTNENFTISRQMRALGLPDPTLY